MKKVFNLIVILVLVIVPVCLYMIFRRVSNGQPTQAASDANKTEVNIVKDVVYDHLETDINNAVAGYPNLSIAVAVADLDHNHVYNAGNSDAVFKGASTIKVLTAVYYMHEVENGNAKLSTVIDGVDAKTLLNKMLQVSDNPAWDSIRDFLGKDEMQAYAKSIGLDSFYGYHDNTIKTKDYVKLLVRLDKGELVSQDSRDLIYSFMQKTENETLMPAAFPDAAVFYHKWGNIWGNVHDVAIVQNKNRRFALVVYTNNPAGTQAMYKTQTKAIQDMTKLVVSTLGV